VRRSTLPRPRFGIITNFKTILITLVAKENDESWFLEGIARRSSSGS
jgi:hypothetical protein